MAAAVPPPPPPPLLGPRPIATIGGICSRYDGPDIRPAYIEPDFGSHSQNTTNKCYPERMAWNREGWDITPEELGVYQPIWDLRADSLPLPSHFQPLDDVLHLPSFPCVFDNEATLAMRMDSTIFVTARRILTFIDDCVRERRQHRPDLPPLLPGPPDVEPLLVEHGAVGFCKIGERNFLPDRCALRRSDMYDALPDDPILKPRGYLFGDIKPSYKFRGHWGWGEHHKRRFIHEFCRVVAQVKFYMLALGWHGEEKASVIYGYVITDLEVVLLKRGIDKPDTIYTSQPFKLRAADRSQEEPDDHGISGMTALIYIHLLASNYESHSVHCRNETAVSDVVAGILKRTDEEYDEDETDETTSEESEGSEFVPESGTGDSFGSGTDDD